eukprot:9256176-Pyramimonas_sp.AAC.1
MRRSWPSLRGWASLATHRASRCTQGEWPSAARHGPRRGARAGHHDPLLHAVMGRPEHRSQCRQGEWAEQP